jgi:hypothetical protein
MHSSLFLALLLKIITPYQSFAFEDSTSNLYLLTEDVRSVVLKTDDNEKKLQKFNLNKNESDQLAAIIQLDKTIDEKVKNNSNSIDCNSIPTATLDKSLSEKIKKRDFEIYTSVVTSDIKFEQNILGQFVDNDYLSFMGNLGFTKNKKAYDILTLTSLRTIFTTANPKIDLKTLSIHDQIIKLNDFASSYVGSDLPSGIIAKELVFDEMVQNSSNWKSAINSANDLLTNDQKIKLVSKLGGQFGNYYNFKRADDGKSASGVVTIEELLNSVKTETPGGVCRDIALAQTQLLKELGFKNNYVVSFKTLSGSHSDVITTNPENGKIIKFNYSETSEMKKGSGVEALVQNSSLPDHGLNYKVSDSDGRPVTIVQSELSRILQEATGGGTREFYPNTYSLQNVGIKINNVNGNLFNGTTSSGDHIYGVALYSKSESDLTSLSGGLAISKREGSRTQVKIDQDNLYLRIANETRTPSKELGGISINGFAGTNTQFLLSNTTESSISSNYTKTSFRELDAQVEGYIGLKSKMQLGDDTTFINKTYTTVYPEFANVADSQSRIIAVKDSVVMKNGLQHRFNKDQSILIESVILLKNYGKNIGFNVAYNDDANKMKISTTLETPASPNPVTFLPGGTPQAKIALDKETKDGFVFSLEYVKDLMNGSNSGFIKASKKF